MDLKYAVTATTTVLLGAAAIYYFYHHLTSSGEKHRPPIVTPLPPPTTTTSTSRTTSTTTITTTTTTTTPTTTTTTVTSTDSVELSNIAAPPSQTTDTRTTTPTTTTTTTTTETATEIATVSATITNTETTTTTTMKKKKPQPVYWVVAQCAIRRYLARKRRSEAEKRFAKRRNVIMEIISTEKSYLSSLEALQNNYILPLRSSFPDYEKALFGRIPEIKKLNETIYRDLLKELEVSFSVNTAKIGSTFRSHIPFLKTYVFFVNDYNQVFERLREFKQTNSKFAKKFEECENAQASQNGLNMQSLMIQPIQRIPRYVLLLSELLKNTPTTHVDYNSLKLALEETSTIAQQINQRKREYEMQQTAIVLQQQLVDVPPPFAPDITHLKPSRRLYSKIECFLTIYPNKQQLLQHLSSSSSSSSQSSSQSSSSSQSQPQQQQHHDEKSQSKSQAEGKEVTVFVFNDLLLVTGRGKEDLRGKTCMRYKVHVDRPTLSHAAVEQGGAGVGVWVVLPGGTHTPGVLGTLPRRKYQLHPASVLYFAFPTPTPTPTLNTPNNTPNTPAQALFDLLTAVISAASSSSSSSSLSSLSSSSSSSLNSSSSSVASNSK